MSTTDCEADPNLDFRDPEVSPFDFEAAVPLDPRVPFITHRAVAGWPLDPERFDEDYLQIGDGRPAYRTDLPSGGHGCSWELFSDILVYPWKTDVHFCQYLFEPELLPIPRLLKSAIERSDGRPMFARPIRMGILSIDADCDRAHRANGGSGGVADEAWRSVELTKQARIRAAIDRPFAYDTRGGYRAVFRLPHPFLIRTGADNLRWRVFYVRCLCWFAREFDVIGDPSTDSWNNLFRAPHATRSVGAQPERYAKYGDARDIGVWPYLPSPATFDDDVKTAEALAKKDALWRTRGLSLLTKRTKGSRPSRSHAVRPTTVQPTPLVLSTMEAELAKEIANIQDGRHGLYLALAGTLLRRGVDPVELPLVIERVASSAGDAKARSRKTDAASTAARYGKGTAVTGMSTLRRDWPRVAGVIDKHLPTPEADGVEDLREELASRPAILAVPLGDVPARISSLIDTTAHGHHKVTLVRVTPGAGKTSAAAAKVGAATSKAALVFGMNELAREHFNQIQLRRPDVQRRFGIASALDGNGKPVCLQSGRVGAVQMAGLSGAALVCKTCPHRDSCSIEGGIEGVRTGAHLMVTNHELLSHAASFVGRQGLLVVDESPRAFDHVALTRSTLESLRKALAAAIYEPRFVAGLRPLLMWLEELFTSRELLPEQPFVDSQRAASSQTRLRTDWSVVAGGAVGALQLGTDVMALDPLVPFTRVMAQRSTPPLRAEALSQIRRGDMKTAETVQASWPLLHALHLGLCTSRGRVEWDSPHAGFGTTTVLRITLPNSAVADVLATSSAVVVLDATGDQQVLGYMSTDPVNTVDIAVEDGAPIERVVRHWANGSRTRALPGGKVSIDVVAPIVKEALERASKFGAQTVLLVSYKPVVDALRAARDGSERHDEKLAAALSTSSLHVVLAHYGAIRGKNALEGVPWNDLDAVITLGDPWPDVAQARAEAELMKLDDIAARSRAYSLAAIELVQVFGRLRAPRRTRPGLLLHFGRVLPSDWHSGNAGVEVRPEGRPPLQSSMALADLKALIRAFGSIRGLAKASGVPESTIRHADSGQRPIGPEMAAKLGPLLAVPAHRHPPVIEGHSGPSHAGSGLEDAVGDGHRLDSGSLCA